METKVLDGKLFKQAMCMALASLRANADEVNELNVFPIPDGDTGENMCATLSGGVHKIENSDSSNIGEVASLFSGGVLLGARGNSGVILSQMLAGLAEGCENKEEIDVLECAKAFQSGVKRAYCAVPTPVEGTMLTVMREGIEYAAGRVNDNSSLNSFCEDALSEMRKSVERTPDLLPALKEAGVVDSGGVGLVYIMEGISKAIRGDKLDFALEPTVSKNADIDFDKFNENSVMEFGYCTEFLLRLTHAKTNIAEFDLSALISWLEQNGDSIVAFITGTVVKVHVHTFNPGKILEHCNQYGEFLTLKVENMSLQHNESVKKEEEAPAFKKVAKHSKYAVIAVADGEGMINTFKDAGATIVIDGGQGHNPSTETFLQAFDAINADTVFVLPNNGNIVMAATQAKEIYRGCEVFVIPTKNPGEGYCALTAFDIDADEGADIAEAMQGAISAAATGLVSYAVRAAHIDSVDIKRKDYIGFAGKHMYVSNPDRITAGLELIDKLGVEDKEFLIVFYGSYVKSEEREIFSQKCQEIYPNLEFYSIDGEQDVYDYVIVLQ